MSMLEKYITQIRGVAYKPEEISDLPQEDYVPILKANNITKNGLDESDLIYIHKSKIGQDQFIKKGDLLIATSSGSKEIVGKHIFFERDYTGSFGAFCKVVRPNANIYPEFVSAFFKTPLYRRHIKKVIQGANINNLRNEHLDSLMIPQFEIADQIKIATVLSKAESLIKKRQASIDLLDEFLKSTFLKMFGDPVDNGKGWEEKTISDFFEIEDGDRGKNYPGQGSLVDNGILFLNTSNFKENELDLEKVSFISEERFNRLTKGKLKANDLIITLRGSVGNVVIFDGHKYSTGFINAQMAILRPVNANIIFCHRLLISGPIQKTFKSASSGSAQPQLPITQLKKIKLISPPIDIQNQFATIVEKAEALKRQFKSSLNALENLYASLSQKVFKGELDLSNLRVTHEEEHWASDNDRTEPEHFNKKANLETLNIEIIKGKQSDSQYGDPFEGVNSPDGQPPTLDKMPPEWEDVTDLDLSSKSKITWSKVSSQEIANWVRDKYSGYHFTSEMLIRFLMEEHVTQPDYYSSEELKKYPQTNESDDLKSFIFSAVNKQNPFLQLEQVFYNAETESLQLNVTDEDFDLIKDRSPQERSGIYFTIVE
jgi:type I restriction enzyme, S subunit